MPVRKRANGEGSVYQRKDGRWVAQYPVRPGKFKTVYCASERDAIKALKRIHSEHLQGTLVHAAGVTVGQYLEDWIERHAATVEAGTADSYRCSIRNHLTPTLGKVKLDRLDAATIEDAYSVMARRGAKPPTIVAAHKVLKKALNDAIRRGRLAVNPAVVVTPPRVAPPRREALRPEAATAFLDWLRGHKLYALCHLAFSLGLRRGELLGLKWSDLDFERRTLTLRHNTVRVRGQGVVVKERPKTDAGFRVLPLIDEVIEVLKEHRRLQDYQRKQLGPHWTDLGLVFASDTGTPRDPTNTSHQIRKLMESAEAEGVKGIRLHGMRHSNATFLGLKGVPLTVASRMLGHSSVDVTADIYTHVFAEQFQDAAISLSALRPKGRK